MLDRPLGHAKRPQQLGWLSATARQYVLLYVLAAAKHAAGWELIMLYIVSLSALSLFMRPFARPCLRKLWCTTNCVIQQTTSLLYVQCIAQVCLASSLLMVTLV